MFDPCTIDGQVRRRAQAYSRMTSLEVKQRKEGGGSGQLVFPEVGQLVHQASEIQPAVRHAVIGISSLHWSGMMKSNSATDDKIESFSLHQCSKALMHLQDNLVANISRRQRMETVLISCGILLSFAFSQGDARAGGCHLRAGYELLLEWQKFEMDKSPIGAVVQALAKCT